MQAAILMGAAPSIISYPISKVIMSANFAALSNAFVVAGIIIILLFFLVSPRFVNELYDAEWAEDLHRIDVTYDDKLTMRLKDFKLSPKEIEVCQLLLQGYTMRQVSVIMSIAYSTVNTYCTAIYRKIDINSRTELIIILKEYTS
jgi:DNA-binding CsgD family transcriptional regulator